MDERPPSLTYLLVDGENIDATLGVSILNRRPAPDERPRWDRVMGFATERWGQQVRALFFLSAQSGTLPMPFVQALLAIGYTPIPLSGAPDTKVVDLAVQRTLQAIADRHGDVMLASHDGDFVPHIAALARQGRKVAVLGFREFVSVGFGELSDEGVELLDLEDHVGAFTYALPRLRIIPIEEFDPLRFL